MSDNMLVILGIYTVVGVLILVFLLNGIMNEGSTTEWYLIVGIPLLWPILLVGLGIVSVLYTIGYTIFWFIRFLYDTREDLENML